MAIGTKPRYQFYQPCLTLLELIFTSHLSFHNTFPAPDFISSSRIDSIPVNLALMIAVPSQANGVDYPLTLPSTNPVVKYFCKNGYTASIGMIATNNMAALLVLEFTNDKTLAISFPANFIN